MAWKYYGLDQEAQKLVLSAKLRDRDSLNQAYKMRMAIAYGLERFWGEHLRLQAREPNKAEFWKETWNSLVQVMAIGGVSIPNDPVSADNTKAIQAMAAKLWQIDMNDRRVAMAVLTQLCDCIVWWTQRCKGDKGK